MAEYMKGINPTIIKWARERSGYTLAEVAKYVHKDVETISNWESGEGAPTYAQLEKLADKFKRPIALFFFPGFLKSLIWSISLRCEVQKLRN